MNSFLITAGTDQERLEKAGQKLKASGLNLKAPHPDLLIINPDPSISIKQIRDLQKFLSRKPYELEKKAVVIPEAEKMTIPAQNSFLKTLEERPKNSIIILCAQNQDQLLETIISRCEIIKLVQKSGIELDKKIIDRHCSLMAKIKKTGLGKRLQLIEPYTKTRSEAVQFCREMIVSLRSRDVNAKAFINNVHIIKKLQKTIQLLQANVNVKLTMENLVIKL